LVPSDCAENAMRLIEDYGYTLAFPARKLSEMQRRSLVRLGREVKLVDPHKRLRVELQ
jgi:hypothetical protein